MDRGIVRSVGLTVAVLTLVVGPWLGFHSGSFVASPAVAFASGPGIVPEAGLLAQAPAPAPRRSGTSTSCSCREVVVEASNVVRDAEVRTGDTEVVNRTLTYIAPSYEDTDVDVEQDAEAISGDAVAGQILAVDGGDGCSRVRIDAKNIVEDAEVRSGDAVARNESVILIDPSISREDLEIEVDQEAVARSGDAVAGQVIDVKGGGACGGVILDALNRVRDVELRTGEALTENVSDILTCTDPGCIDDIRKLLGDVDTVDVCDADGCEPVPVKEFVERIEEQAEGESDPAPGDEGDEEDEPGAKDDPLDNPKVRQAQPWRYPRRERVEPTPTPTPTPTPVPEATPA